MTRLCRCVWVRKPPAYCSPTPPGPTCLLRFAHTKKDLFVWGRTVWSTLGICSHTVSSPVMFQLCLFPYTLRQDETKRGKAFPHKLAIRFRCIWLVFGTSAVWIKRWSPFINDEELDHEYRCWGPILMSKGSNAVKQRCNYFLPVIWHYFRMCDLQESAALVELKANSLWINWSFSCTVEIRVDQKKSMSGSCNWTSFNAVKEASVSECRV